MISPSNNALISRIVCFIVFVFLLISTNSFSQNSDSFTNLIKNKEYSTYLENSKNTKEIYTSLKKRDISWEDYVELMIYADAIQHSYRDSIITYGICYLSSLGIEKSANGNYDKAIAHQNQALSLIPYVRNIDRILLAGIYRQLGINYYNLGDYNKSILYAEKEYEILKDITDTLSITSSLNNLGLYNYYNENYEIAHKYLREAYDFSLNFDKNHPERIRCLNNFLLVLSQMGMISESLKYIEEYIAILHSYDHLYVVALLNNASELCAVLGHYEKAIDYAEKGLEALNEIKIPNNEKLRAESFFLNNLSLAYFYLNNKTKAIEYAEKVIRIDEYKDKNHKALFLGNLGLIYSSIDFNKSLEFYNQALQEVSQSNIYYPQLLCNIGLLYHKTEAYDEALIYYEMALKALDNLEFIASPSTYACVYTNLSAIYEYLGNENLSLELCEKSLEIVKSSVVHGELFALLKSNLAYKYSRANGKENKAYELWNEVLKDYSGLIADRFDFLTENERNLYWENSTTLREYLPAFVLDNNKKHKDYVVLAYNNVLLSKGILLQTTNNVRNSILQSNDSLLKNKLEEFISAKELLTSNHGSIEYRASVQENVEELEKWLMKNSKEYRQSKEIWNIDWLSIKNNLLKNEISLEFIDFRTIPEDTVSKHMYCALLLRHNSKYPELIPLFEEKEVASYLDKATEGTTNNLYSFEGDGEHISNLVWSKILSKVKPGETIYFAPTGILHQLAIEYLPYDEQRTMSDVYNMVRLSSTREIVTNKSKESYNSAVVYGGIHYDLDNDNMLAESRRYRGLKHRTLENDSINRGSAKFLPGTKEEAEKINRLLTDNKIEAVIYKTKSANEESFKSLNGKHNNILHIATHGFTWTDSTARKQDYFADRMKMQLVGDNQMRGPVIDPLDRCGLLFAGANTALQGKSNELPEGVQDGILTAKEISLMDLRDAELVVLSACETAKGDITSEGVFGLQRAFKMAGAKTIIMSLWRVDDRATQLLMTEFYTNWITKKQAKREAFHNAQNTVKKQYPEPSYWAGFVMLD